METPMAAVLERCASLGTATPMQYVARWTEIAVVARERGYLAPDAVESIDTVRAVDVARDVIEEALQEAVAREEGCGEEEARARTKTLVSGLARPCREAGTGGRGKRRSADCPRPLREVTEQPILHEERWNRCAEKRLSMKAAVRPRSPEYVHVFRRGKGGTVNGPTRPW